MHLVISKTLGGLSPQYYFRHLVFGVGIAAFVVFMASKSPHLMQFGVIALKSVLPVRVRKRHWLYHGLERGLLERFCDAVR